jgi:hypothetical protein
MAPQHDGVRTETRTRFIEGEGFLVEEVEIGAPLGANSIRVPKATKEPALPVVITVADISLDLACQVIKANGLLAVPASFLNEQQLEELQIDPSLIQTGTTVPAEESANPPAAKKLGEKETIKRIQAAISFEELNELTATESRAAVLAAAETKAAELKG